MTVLYKITAKAVDPKSGNVTVQVAFWDDASPNKVYTDSTFAVDLTDASIADWAAKRYTAFVNGESAAAALTLGVEATAVAKIDPSLAADARAKEVTFRALAARAQVLALNDEPTTRAYDAWVAARDLAAGISPKG